MNSRSYQARGSPFSILQRKPDIPLVGSFHAPAQQAHPFSTLLLLVNDSGEGDSSTFPRAEGQVTDRSDQEYAESHAADSQQGVFGGGQKERQKAEILGSAPK